MHAFIGRRLIVATISAFLTFGILPLASAETRARTRKKQQRTESVRAESGRHLESTRPRSKRADAAQRDTAHGAQRSLNRSHPSRVESGQSAARNDVRTVTDKAYKRPGGGFRYRGLQIRPAETKQGKGQSGDWIVQLYSVLPQGQKLATIRVSKAKAFKIMADHIAEMKGPHRSSADD